MYLATLIIVNYKSCQYLEINPYKDDPTVLIGINDCGKSTILKAIGLLLDVKPNYHYQKDGSMKNDLAHQKVKASELQENLERIGLPMLPYNDTNNDKTFVLGKLVPEPADMAALINQECTPHLSWTLDGQAKEQASIWLARSFEVASEKEDLYLLTPDTKEGAAYYDMSQANLKKVQQELDVSDDKVENENGAGPFKKLERVRAVYKYGELELVPRWAEYKIKKDQGFFPVFRYMDWMVSMDDLENHANEILQNEIEEYLKEAQTKATAIANQAQAIVNDKLKDISDEITADIPDVELLEANIHFELKSKLTDFLVRKRGLAKPVHIDNQGDGMRRQIWFGLMRWKAKTSDTDSQPPKQFIWCFDEPETHLYPRAQREFFGLIKKIAQQNIQVLLSTHSSIFVDRAKLHTIHKVNLEDGLTFFSKCSDTEDVYTALQIRNSDFLFYDRFLLVEGDTEAVLIPHLYRIYTGRNLYDDGIQLVKLGSSTKREQNLKILEDLLSHYQKVDDRAVLILDNDVRLNGGKTTIGNTFFVGKQDIEDSICSKVWSQLYSDHLPDGITLSEEEVEVVKANIPEVRELNGNNKFFKELLRKINEKIEIIEDKELQKHCYIQLPKDKGTLTSEKLCNYLTDISQIDPNIKAAFDRLKD